MSKQAQNARIAAIDLINKAMRNESESIADLYIGSACRIDQTLKPVTIKAVWIEKWLQTNKNRTGAKYE